MVTIVRQTSCVLPLEACVTFSSDFVRVRIVFVLETFFIRPRRVFDICVCLHILAALLRSLALFQAPKRRCQGHIHASALGIDFHGRACICR